MLTAAILVVGVLLIGGIHLRDHRGNWSRAALDTTAWLLIMVGSQAAIQIWPRNHAALAACLLVALLAAIFLKKTIRV